MRLPGFLSPPPKGQRARSKARSDVEATQDPSETDLTAVLPPAKQDPEPGASTSPTFAPPTLQSGVSSGASTSVFWEIRLIVLPWISDNVIPESAQSVTRKAKRPGSRDYILNWRAVSSESKSESSWKSTAYASTKLVVDVVRESSDVFPPFKSVVGGLTAVLKHCDVRSVSPALLIILMATPASDNQSANDRIFNTSD